MTEPSTHATHTAAEKPLTGSTVTCSNFQTDTNVEPVDAPNERNRATVKPCDPESETGAELPLWAFVRYELDDRPQWPTSIFRFVGMSVVRRIAE